MARETPFFSDGCGWGGLSEFWLSGPFRPPYDFGCLRFDQAVARPGPLRSTRFARLVRAWLTALLTLVVPGQAGAQQQGAAALAAQGQLWRPALTVFVVRHDIGGGA